MKYQAIAFGTDKYSLGEGPYYDPRFSRLSFVDITEGNLWVSALNNERICYHMDLPVCAAVPLDHSEGFLVAAKDGLYRMEDGQFHLVYGLNEIYKPYWRTNDAKADPCGRLWFGSITDDDRYQAGGNLYCFDGTQVLCKQADTKLANGMAWSSDHRHFYFSDSTEHAVFKYDYHAESGDLSDRKLLFQIEDGVPDGMCIDSDDNLWVAVWGGRRIEKRCGRTGCIMDVVEVPAEHVSSCCFGGENMNTLYITSSGNGLTGEYDGCLFTCQVDATGVVPDYVRIDR